MKRQLYTSLFISCMCFLVHFSFGQKEANNWYFGNKAGLTFNSGTAAPLTNGNLVTSEGCATISDKTTGQLLFYTDGTTVWNSQHGVMPNGTGLLGNPSSTQSAIAIPMPDSSNKYYIFTVDAQAGIEGANKTEYPSTTGFGGVAYSIVDMTLDGGLGDISTKNISVLTPTCEKLTAVRACNGRDIWVAVHQWNTNAFYTYLVSPTGISAPVISNVGLDNYDVGSGVNKEAVGYLKFSPDGKHVASVMYYDINQMQLFDFDNSTGVISNAVTDDANWPAQISGIDGLYGCTFSPDNSKLYVSWFGYQNGVTNPPSYIYQYNMLAGSSAAIVASKTEITSSAGNGYGAMQVGPDGKIYVSKTDYTNTNSLSDYLDVIESPNSLGSNCQYSINGQYLGGAGVNQSVFGLPDFVESFTIPEYSASLSYSSCGGSSSVTFTDSTLNGTITTLWNFGDPNSGTSDTSTQTNGTHTYTTSGTYTATLYLTNACETDTFTKSITVGALTDTIIVNSEASCGKSNGSATVNVSGGDGSYTYSWSSGATGATATNLAQGLNKVTVTQSGNCSATASVNINQTGGITISATSTNTSCGLNNGTAKVQILSGTPIQYSWSTQQTTDSISNLPYGTYTVTVTGTGGCTVTDTVSVNQSTGIDVTITYTNASCGASNGTAKAVVTSGVATAYNWSNQETTDSISGLPADTYSVTVTGLGGCTDTASVTITGGSNAPITITSPQSIICSGDSTQICAPGGFASYRWNNGQTSQCIEAKNAGDFYVSATNGGCTVQSNHLPISVYPVPSVSIVVEGDTLSSFDAVTYQWLVNGTAIPGATDPVYIAQKSGAYSVVITDSNGCTETSSEVNIGSVNAGIREVNNEIDFSIYPNPVSAGFLQLVAPPALYGNQYEIYDALGRIVTWDLIRNQKTQIDMDRFSSGVYFIKLAGAVKKIIKQ